jgi:hypothetical protein
LEVIGFVANRELGVSYLHKVHDFGGVRSEFFLLFLCSLFFVLSSSSCLLINVCMLAPSAAAILAMNYLFIPRALSDVKEQLGFAGPIINACLRNYPYLFATFSLSFLS